MVIVMADERAETVVKSLLDRHPDGLAVLERLLKNGGGGGNSGGMDEKIAALEKRVDRFEGKIDGLSKEISDLRVQTATLTERIAHLPSKEFIYKGIAGLVAAMVAVSVLAPKLQGLFGVHTP